MQLVFSHETASKDKGSEYSLGGRGGRAISPRTEPGRNKGEGSLENLQADWPCQMLLAGQGR